MKIAIHNVEFLFGEGTHIHSGQEWLYTNEVVKARIDHFAKLFSKINADVLLLQEVASKDVIERIIKQSGIDYLYFIAVPDQNGVGNAILYKDKEAVCESIPAVAPMPVFVEGDNDTIGPRIWSRRDFVHIRTTWNKKQINILGIHIKSNFLMVEKRNNGKNNLMNTQISVADGLIRSELFRFSQAKKAREIIDSFFANNPNAQIIVGGDFNAEENNSVFRIIRGDIKDGADSLISSHQSIPNYKKYSISSGGKTRLIDHILISKELEASLGNTKIINENISEHKNIAPNFSSIESDHAPMVIELV